MNAFGPGNASPPPTLKSLKYLGTGTPHGLSRHPLFVPIAVDFGGVHVHVTAQTNAIFATLQHPWRVAKPGMRRLLGIVATSTAFIFIILVPIITAHTTLAWAKVGHSS